MDLHASASSGPSQSDVLLSQRLKLQNRHGKDNLGHTLLDVSTKSGPLSTLEVSPEAMPIPSEVLYALHAIRTTPFENSFASRLVGTLPAKTLGLLLVDWESRSVWMNLMSDIREHYAFMHPERGQANETEAPIEYVTMQPGHLGQIHDLLIRAFWADIDVSDSLRFSPEMSTVVATYKKVVVGVAILTSPQETYLTYLAVKAGWENCRIATNMLYHLIMLNPNKDITLHVSANSSAMLLYNQFGFKAEQFVAGFYDAYMDPRSRASRNAFRLRLRR